MSTTVAGEVGPAAGANSEPKPAGRSKAPGRRGARHWQSAIEPREAAAAPRVPALDAEGGSSLHASEMEERLAVLGALPRIEYERCRLDAARELRVRVPILDAEIRRRRMPAETSAGAAVHLPDPEPCAEAVDGGELLSALRETYRRYLVLPAHADVALALWTMFVWVIDAFEVAPLLAVISPEKRCGKTTLLHLLYALTKRALFASNITPATLFRAVERFKPTLIVDEADTFLRNSDELRGVLNAGHTRTSAVVIRTVGDEHEPRPFSVWGPKVIAMIGRLPDTLEDRSIGIPMKRRAPHELVARLRLDRPGAFQTLQARAARWALDHCERLRGAEPPVPEELHDRAADNWRPLLAIAERAGGTWPADARAAARALSGVTDPSASTGAIALLADLRELVGDRERMTTEWILAQLHKRNEAPWPTWNKGKPINARQIANLLRPFGIRSEQLHPENVKGYTRHAFEDAFGRYLDPNVPNNRNASEHIAAVEDPNGTGSRSHEAPGASPRTDGARSAPSDTDPGSEQPELEF